MDLSLVDAVDADPHEVAADDRAPQGVSGSQVEIKAEIKEQSFYKAICVIIIICRSVLSSSCNQIYSMRLTTIRFVS